jgi:hypothetical protein
MSNQYPPCPSCKQNDMVQPASRANLSAPIKPSNTVVTLVRVWQWLFGGIFGFGVLVLLGGSLLGGFSVLLAGSYDESGFTSLIGGTMLLPVLCVGIGFLIIGGTIMVLIPWLGGRYVTQNYQKRLAQWQRAMEKYQKLWFCSRCAGVWMEGQNRLVPVEHLQSFLYELQPTEPSYPLS